MIAATTSNLLYDGSRLVAEYDAAGALRRRWVHGAGVDEPLVAYEGSGTSSKGWLYADHLGSIVASADASGASSATYRYGPYGEPDTTSSQRFRYSGQQLIGALGRPRPHIQGNRQEDSHRRDDRDLPLEQCDPKNECQ